MNEIEKKIGFIAIFAVIIIFFLVKNNKKENSRIQHKKYTIVKVLNSEVSGKNFTKYNFFLDGKYRENTSNKFLYKNQRDSIIGKNVLIEYDSTNLNNSKIIFGYEIPQNISSPENGWKNIPKKFKKITKIH